MAEKDDFNEIVRVVDVDVPGRVKVFSALRKVKGVGFSFANAICKSLNLDANKQVGYLKDDELKKILIDTYRPLIENGEISIKYNGETLKANPFPVDSQISKFSRHEISTFCILLLPLSNVVPFTSVYAAYPLLIINPMF